MRVSGSITSLKYTKRDLPPHQCFTALRCELIFLTHKSLSASKVASLSGGKEALWQHCATMRPLETNYPCPWRVTLRRVVPGSSEGTSSSSDLTAGSQRRGGGSLESGQRERSPPVTSPSGPTAAIWNIFSVLSRSKKQNNLSCHLCSLTWGRFSHPLTHKHEVSLLTQWGINCPWGLKWSMREDFLFLGNIFL